MNMEIKEFDAYFSITVGEEDKYLKKLLVLIYECLSVATGFIINVHPWGDFYRIEINKKMLDDKYSEVISKLKEAI